ncbi:MAG: hypothetical protein NW241_21470 [Bacteroidia bacterium]|nr:hypothetical protein [Bacteroidia bacterium]
MRLEQLMLVIAGLLGIGAFFLPFLSFESALFGVQLASVHISGLSLTQSLLDFFKVIEHPEGRAAFDIARAFVEQASSPMDYARIAGGAFILAGPFIYLLYALGYLVRGLAKRQFKRGILFNILFPAAAWAILYFLFRVETPELPAGELLKAVQIEIPRLNFFTFAGIGFWLAFAGIWIAGFSLLFEKNAK